MLLHVVGTISLFISIIGTAAGAVIPTAFDSETGLFWRTLSGTQSHSYAEMVDPSTNNCNPTCTNGPFAGWTFADEPHVTAFMEHFGLSPYGPSSDVVSLTNFINLMGPTFSLPPQFPDQINIYVAGISRSIDPFPPGSLPGDPSVPFAPGAYRLDCCFGFQGTSDVYPGLFGQFDFGPSTGGHHHLTAALLRSASGQA